MRSTTFDSNVWRRVASPYRFPNDPAAAAVQRIRTAIQAGELAAFIAEPVLTLEAIARKQRRDFLDEYEPSLEIVEVPVLHGTSLTIEVGPDLNAWPGMHSILRQHFSDAMALGIRVLHAPRIGGVINPEVAPHDYAQDPTGAAGLRQKRTFELMNAIERRGGGIAHVKQLVAEYAPGDAWHKSLLKVPVSDKGRFASAIAEWADGDSVAAHYGYSVDAFCSEDIGKGAGATSSLSLPNRTWLTSQFGIRFTTLIGLAAQLP